MEGAIARLEAVATRLEAVEGRLAPGAAPDAAPRAPAAAADHTPVKFGVPLPGLTPAKKPAPPAAAPAAQTAAAPGGSGAALLQAWDTEVGAALQTFSKAVQAVGQEVLPASELVEKAFQAERTVVDAISQCQRPDGAGLAQLLAPVGAQLQAANAATEGRRTPAFNHAKAVAEALQALSWVAYAGPACGMSPPAQHVQEAWQSAEFWANKVLMEHRASSPGQVAWVRALQALLAALKAYVQSHHREGPAWQAGGAPLAAFAPSAAAAAAAGSAAPAAAPAPAKAAAAAPKPPSAAPPPPPPPAAGSLFKAKGPAGAAAAAGGVGLSAVFSEINKKGDGVTSGLRKVTDDMKTKNRADRSGVVSAAAAGSGAAAAAAAAAQPAKGPGGKVRQAAPPRTECEQGRKWVVENHSGAHDIVLSETSAKQTVYIYRCSNATIQVRGKVNALTVDACSRVGVLCESLVAAAEVVNSSGVQLQATGTVPTIAVDKCDGVQLFLSEASMAASITTAKSSAVNVLVPGAGPGADMRELYVPEQFISRLENGRLVTVPVSHSGG